MSLIDSKSESCWAIFPLLGQRIPDAIPVLVGALAAALVLDEIFKSKKTRRKEKLSQGQLCFLGGLAVALLMASLMLSGSLFITFPYGVEENPGVLMGSNVGILALGTSQEIELAELNNSGFIPTFYFAVSSDPQVVLEQCHYPGQGRCRQGDSLVYAQSQAAGQCDCGHISSFLPPGIIGVGTNKLLKRPDRGCVSPGNAGICHPTWSRVIGAWWCFGVSALINLPSHWLDAPVKRPSER